MTFIILIKASPQMALYFIKHITKYTYSSFVIDGATQIKLFPFNNEYQKVVSQNININGNPEVFTYQDFYSNKVGTFMLVKPHDFLSIESEIEVITSPVIFPEDTVAPKDQWNVLSALKEDSLFMDFLKFITFDGTPEIASMISDIDLETKTPYNVALEFCEFIYSNFNYIQGVTNVDSKLDHVWQLRAGVCQDFTNILLQMVRMAGIPARYVSGYICPNDSKTRGEGATHAWIEVYIPYYGWLGLDPTNNLIASDHHIKLAMGKNYSDCTPVKGVYRGKVSDYLYVKVHVSTTKNYNTIATAQSDVENDEVPEAEPIKNSYRRHLEFIQQQQQQQQ